jgi:hypothetical protein
MKPITSTMNMVCQWQISGEIRAGQDAQMPPAMKGAQNHIAVLIIFQA